MSPNSEIRKQLWHDTNHEDIGDDQNCNLIKQKICLVFSLNLFSSISNTFLHIKKKLYPCIKVHFNV